MTLFFVYFMVCHMSIVLYYAVATNIIHIVDLSWLKLYEFEERKIL